MAAESITNPVIMRLRLEGGGCGGVLLCAGIAFSHARSTPLQRGGSVCDPRNA